MTRKQYEQRQLLAAQIVNDFHGEGDADLANRTEAASRDPLEAQAVMYALARLAVNLADQVAEATGRSLESAVERALKQSTEKAGAG